MKKIALNGTTLIKGGALQACVSFIRQAVDASNNFEWFFLVSPEIAKELVTFNIHMDSLNVTILGSPAKSKTAREKLYNIVNDIKPDAVFTFFGPAYVDFDYPHLMGVANGWVTHASSLALRKRGGPIELVKYILSFFYRRYWYKKADMWVVEAECAREGMKFRFGVDGERIAVVPNNCGDHYTNNQDVNDNNTILVFSSYYPHKNLEIIPYVALELKKIRKAKDFKFLLTIERDTREEKKLLSSAKSNDVVECLNNIGPVPIAEGPSMYKKSSVVFMPSILETFSAVYPEAMISNRPIITSDLAFAHDVCGDAALYFDPLCPIDAAEKIQSVLIDKDLYSSMVSKGKKIVKHLPSQEEKFNLYCGLLDKLLSNTTYRNN